MCFGVDWVFVVQWVVQIVDNVIQQFWVNWNVNDGVGVFYSVIFFNVMVGIKDNNINVVVFQVQSYFYDIIREFDYFICLNIVQIINVGDIVIDGKYMVNFGNFGFLIKVFDLVFQDC